ncbi:hypothetical protein [Fenollaria sporofastidiosus]|uniref:hypothetical protein n=1 Tax=Fenollaria sporofastidiosus TaxID=2811778 RepID=UPI001BFFDCC6|nr:hypothetical protein [Fenollaria sporofastidiosus]
MNKKIALFLLVLCLLMSFGCTNTKKESKNDIETKNEMTEETRISELEKENKKLNKKIIDLDIKAYTNKKMLDFYKGILSNMNEKADDDLKNKIVAATINPVFSMNDAPLSEEEVLSINELENNTFSVNLSYDNVDPELVRDYSLTFKRRLPYLDSENLFEIKTKAIYNIMFLRYHYVEKVLITFKDLKVGDTITIVLSDELAKLCDYKSGSITINIVD